jgi:uncharacterized protein YjbI with pentapeptide repeats
MDRLAAEGSFLERVDFSAQEAADISLEQCRLSHLDLTGAGLKRLSVRDALVVGGSWANVRTEEVRLRRVAFKGVRMTGANLSSASLEDVSFTECRIDLGAFRFARLNRVRFAQCRLDEIDFSNGALQSVTFLDCVMTRAMWAEATLTRCEMRGCDISGAGNPERLRGVRMTFEDVLACAAELAAAAGVEIVE